MKLNNDYSDTTTIIYITIVTMFGMVYSTVSELFKGGG